MLSGNKLALMVTRLCKTKRVFFSACFRPNRNKQLLHITEDRLGDSHVRLRISAKRAPLKRRTTHHEKNTAHTTPAVFKRSYEVTGILLWISKGYAYTRHEQNCDEPAFKREFQHSRKLERTDDLLQTNESFCFHNMNHTGTGTSLSCQRR